MFRKEEENKLETRSTSRP